MMDYSFSMQSCKSPHPLSGALCSLMEASANDLSKWQQSTGALQQVHINLVGDPVDEWPCPRSSGRSHLNYAEGATPGRHPGMSCYLWSNNSREGLRSTWSSKHCNALGKVSLHSKSMEDIIAVTNSRCRIEERANGCHHFKTFSTDRSLEESEFKASSKRNSFKTLLFFLWWCFQQNIFTTALIVPHYLGVLCLISEKKHSSPNVTSVKHQHPEDGPIMSIRMRNIKGKAIRMHQKLWGKTITWSSENWLNTANVLKQMHNIPFLNIQS